MAARRAPKAQHKPRPSDRPVPELQYMVDKDAMKTHQPRTKEEVLITKLLRPQ